MEAIAAAMEEKLLVAEESVSRSVVPIPVIAS